MTPPETRDWVQRLLEHEAVVGKPYDPAEPAAFRVYERLRRALCALAGVDGFRALASRALTLARSEVPGLREVEIAADGSLRDLGELQIDKDHGEEAVATFIAQLLGLLLTFIGETLMLRLLQDVWPDAAFDDHDSGGERKA